MKNTKKINGIVALVDLVNLYKSNLIHQTLKLDEVYDKLNTNLTYLIELYYRPKYKKFDILEFHKNKSKLFIICSNFIDIQKYLFFEPDNNLIELYLDDIDSNNEKLVEFINIIRNLIYSMKKRNKVYNIYDLKNYVIDKLIKIANDTNNKNYNILSNLVESENRFIYFISELNDLRFSNEEYQKKLIEIYNQVIFDYDLILNKYPEYHSMHIAIENNLLTSVKDIIFEGKEDFQKLELPEKEIVFKTKVNFKNISIRSYQKEIPLFSKNILSKIVNIIKYKPFTYKSNLKFLDL